MTSTLLVGQSADPDDAFMAWGMASGKVEVAGCEIEVHFADIQSLNEWALAGRFDLTALSAAAYPDVADRYRLLACGASFGREYGPIVVGPEPPAARGREAIRGLRVAVPGLQTTAYMLLRASAGDSFAPVVMPFDEILAAVRDRAVEAGLIIHEGQLTYQEHGLYLLFEPARQWHRRYRLPVPLGVVAVRRALGPQRCQAVASAFQASIRAAQEEPESALTFASVHARGLDDRILARFVDQYVDDLTETMGAEGRTALEQLYRDGRDAGLLTAVPPLDLLEPEEP